MVSHLVFYPDRLTPGVGCVPDYSLGLWPSEVSGRMMAKLAK